MTPEATRFLQTTDDHLERGQVMLATGLNYDAGRAAAAKWSSRIEASRANFCAAQKKIQHLHRTSAAFFPEPMISKPVADYDTGPIAEGTSQEASEAMQVAHKFVATVRRTLTPDPA